MRAFNRADESFGTNAEREKRDSTQRRLKVRLARIQCCDLEEAELELREALGRAPSEYLMTAGLDAQPLARSLT